MNSPPIAVTDSIIVPVSGTKSTITFNILSNDFDPENDEFVLTFIYSPAVGQMNVDCNGNFTYTAPEQFYGTVTTTYIICETENNENCGEGKIIILVKKDYDNDGIADDEDVDDDNDGILDVDESLTADNDDDGVPNYLDIDSDNDGIPDNIEAQSESDYISPLWSDSNKNGWDDAYDIFNGGKYFTLRDTDNDGTPDFLDSDSDNDNLSDLFEAVTEQPRSSVSYGTDSDNDGLDDNFDIILGWVNNTNPLGSNVTLPDSDNNGIRDWRDSKSVKPVDGDGSALQNIIFYFKIYPNPASNEFLIEVPSDFLENTIKIEIVNTSGKIIYISEIQNSITNFSTSVIGKGLYIVRLTSNSSVYTQRLIIR